MATDSRQGGREGEAANRGGWYFIKGIPVAVIITLVGVAIGQTAAFTWFLADLSRDVSAVKDRQAEHSVKLDKTDGKLDALTNVVQGSTVPNALNAARIATLEQGLAELRSRVSANERGLSIESLRNRESRQ